jgi:hypothetical protein
VILRRLDGKRFSEVLPLWADETVCLLGGGPSLTSEQIVRVREAHERGDVRCIAVNDCYLVAPFADVLYFADVAWWRWHVEGVEKPALGINAQEVRKRFDSFRGQRCSIQAGVTLIQDERVHFLRNKHYPHHGTGLSLERDAIVTGRNSGFQALNVAILAGAKRILLLGFDGRPALDGRAHWHGGHPKPPHPAAWKAIVGSFDAAEREIQKAGVEVINCSATSQIGFRKMAIEDALP